MSDLLIRRDLVNEIVADIRRLIRDVEKFAAKWSQLTAAEKELARRKAGDGAVYLERIDHIASGTLTPKLFLATTPGARRLSVLPIKEQQRWTQKQKIPVLRHDGTVDERDYNQLFGTTVEQVFAEDHVRTPAEQEQWLASRNGDAPVVAQHEGRWRRVGRKVYFEPGLAERGVTLSDLKEALRSYGYEI